MKPKRTKHDYTSEVELSSLLIREKNKKTEKNLSHKYNNRINEYIKTHTKLNRIKYEKNSKKYFQKNVLKNKIRDRIISLSEKTCIDKNSHERFGEVILLMIKHILTKPNFSGYTYITDFYSDAIYKIFTYLHNFDHTLVSERTNTRVNAFAYISQIIHNSIVFIIKKKNNERAKINNIVTSEIRDLNINIKDYKKESNSSHIEDDPDFKKQEEIEVFMKEGSNLFDEVTKIKKTLGDKIAYLYYPESYKISVEEYYKIKPNLNGINVLSIKNYKK